MRIDLHIHTRGSDGWGTAEEIADEACKAGLDGLAITDHHRTRTAEGDAVEAACRARGLQVFRGAEYSCADGHCLVFGVAVEDLGLEMYPPMETVMQRAREAGGVGIPAHPYHGYRSRLGSGLAALPGLVALEGMNGQEQDRSPEENLMALHAAQALHVPVTGGSDAHSPQAIGICFTVFDYPIATDGELVAALLAGHFQAGWSPERLQAKQARWMTQAMTWAEDEREEPATRAKAPKVAKAQKKSKKSKTKKGRGQELDFTSEIGDNRDYAAWRRAFWREPDPTKH